MPHCRPLIHLYAPNGTMYKPTICETAGFSPTADAENLKKALLGLGTNERGLINIIGNRTSAERVAICNAYQSMLGKTPYDLLHNALSGSFRKLVLLLIMSPWQVMAKALHKAMKSAGTKERVLNEIIASCSKNDISNLKKAFEDVSGGTTLEDAIKGDTSGHYCEALLLTLADQCEETDATKLRKLSPNTLYTVVNPCLAETDAKQLYTSGEGRLGRADINFMRLIITRSFLQLGAMNDAYIRMYGHSLIDAIKKEASGNFKIFLITRVRYAIDRPSLYAELLHSVLTGAGTKDCTLQRVLALRSDIDLESIKDKYSELYGETLEVAIGNDTSGDYKDLCLRLLGSA